MKVDISLGSDGLLYKYEFLLLKKFASETPCELQRMVGRSGHFWDRIPIRCPGTDFTIKSTDLEPRKKKTFTLPETNIFAPKNGWLEYEPFLLGFGLFSGAFTVSFRVPVSIEVPPKKFHPTAAKNSRVFFSTAQINPWSQPATETAADVFYVESYGTMAGSKMEDDHAKHHWWWYNNWLPVWETNY